MIRIFLQPILYYRKLVGAIIALLTAGAISAFGYSTFDNDMGDIRLLMQSNLVFSILLGVIAIAVFYLKEKNQK